MIQGERWTIGLGYGEKGRHAELYASSDRLTGQFVEGRTRCVYGSISRGISVPLGTIRHRIVMELVRLGRAEIVPQEPDW